MFKHYSPMTTKLIYSFKRSLNNKLKLPKKFKMNQSGHHQMKQKIVFNNKTPQVVMRCQNLSNLQKRAMILLTINKNVPITPR